jgi:pimeloyl-ACP methyl ester carboxylesterase
VTVNLGHRVDEFALVDHHFQMPLDHSEPAGEMIGVYAREVTARYGGERPWLVFLQGGPGGEAPRPLEITGWLERATVDFRVLLLDQRGTGLSTPITRQTLPARGDAQAQAQYLKHFRADSIVADCELIRSQLLGPTQRWSVLGQSYGGYCATTYLSFAPDGLERVLMTGGLPPLDATVDEIYRMTYGKVRDRNRVFASRYPADVETLNQIRDHLASTDVRLPGGDRLTPQRLQYLGLGFGMVGGYETVHYLLEQAWHATGELSDAFLLGVEATTSLTVNPLFALMHEAIYCQGYASNWSADRIRGEFPEFAPDASPFHFTGEMMFPWMFDNYGVLAPMHDAAHLIAEATDWPAVYDVDRLATNTVPVAAAVYFDDMYVAREFSVDASSRIKGTEIWVTNTYEHDALRRDGAAVFDRLLKMTHRG